MKCVDFTKSKVVANGNKFFVVFNVESVATITRKDGTIIDKLYQCELCRSEKVFNNEILFTPKNHPYVPVFSLNGGGVLFRSKLKRRDVEVFHKKNEMLCGYEIFEKRQNAAVCIDLTDAAVKSLEGRCLTAATTIAFGDEMSLRIEYPIRTINVDRSKTKVQVDTGPVVLAIYETGEPILSCCRLAHVAFWQPDRVNFIVKNRTTLCECETKEVNVFDYAKNLLFDAENIIYCVG